MSALGYRSNMRGGYDELKRCRRKNCGHTVPMKKWCCSSCWLELSSKSRRDLLFVLNWLNVHPGDEAALRCLPAAEAACVAEWEPLPMPDPLAEPEVQAQ